MPTTCQNRAAAVTAQSTPRTPKPNADARLAAVVEAAYILEARTR